jgi:hypothetical protein
MITHEEAREIIEYENANQEVFTDKQLDKLRSYFIQQEKKDKLLELYRDLINQDDRLNTLRIYRKIQALEEELK